MLKNYIQKLLLLLSVVYFPALVWFIWPLTDNTTLGFLGMPLSVWIMLAYFAFGYLVIFALFYGPFKINFNKSQES